MKTRGNPSGPGAMTKPRLQRPDIWMQPDSFHHAQDLFAQGLGPYMEILDQRVRTPTLEIAYKVTGPVDGLPVILLHGWPSDPHDYDEVAPALGQARCRVF